MLWELSFERTTRGIAIIDPRSRNVVAVNPAFARMHGGRVGDFVAKPLDESLPPERRRSCRRWPPTSTGTASSPSSPSTCAATAAAFPVAVDVMAATTRTGGSCTALLVHRPDRAAAARPPAPPGRAAVRERLPRRSDRDGDRRRRPQGIRATPPSAGSPGTARGAALARLRHPHPPRRHRGDLQGDERLLRGEVTDYQLEKRYIRKNGEPVWALVSVSLDRDENGEPQRYIVHVQDISLRKRMESDLSQAAAVAELSRDLICTVGADDHLARLDGRWDEVLGWGEEELTSRPLADFIHPDDRLVTLDELAQVRKSGRPGSLRPAGRRARATGPGCCGRCRARRRRRGLLQPARADDRIEVEKSSSSAAR